MTNEEEHAEIKESMKEIGDDVKTIKRYLLGNGKIGLVSQVLIMWRGSMWTIGTVAVLALSWLFSRLI